jgi:hypothetical protein
MLQVLHVHFINEFLKTDLIRQADDYKYTHSQIGHYFFSYLLTCEVYLIEILEIMAQMWQYIYFLSLTPIKVSSEFVLNYLKKNCKGHHHSEISKTNSKTTISSLCKRP